MIAAGHTLTASAGCQALRAGGNAIDAAVAAAFMTFVAEPSLTTIAGGGFLLMHEGKTRRTRLLDFFAAMPGRGRRAIRTSALDFHAVHLDFGGTTQEFHIGCGAAAVPGNVHGLCTAHRLGGRLPLAEVLAPAIEAAKTGITITPSQALILSVVRGTVMATAGTRALYAPRGHLLRAGEVFRNADLADTLEQLVHDGIAEFYKGDIAHRIAAQSAGHGGLVNREDLAAYRTIIRRPLAFCYRGHPILTNPAPSLGGPLIAFALQLLEGLVPPRHLAPQDPRLYRALVEVMRITNEARATQRTFPPRIVHQYRRVLRARLAAQVPATALPTTPFRGLGNTTHVSVLDEHHNAASVTTSHGEGNGVCVPGTGIVFNNLLGEEDINPHGFHQWVPGARLPSMMAPTMLMRRGLPWIVLGSAGSNRLRTAIVQTIVQWLDMRVPMARAVNGPRLHWERGQLDVEPGFSRRTLAALRHTEPNLVPWREKNLFFGGLHAVMRGSGGHFDGAGDVRRGGIVKKV